ncbi:MAG: TRAM domain-containing protein [Propionibacteriaceae bacterium]|jgi:tRNA/tmRNA/rRNA uracil-C5-methylase (TrmA/RlmC/RlmD family)|nr:TRAM domain-containing protein [Propionibacteriaceae bacterium]
MNTLRAEKPANGGSCIAHLDGKVVFLRGAAPGELVEAEITQSRSKLSNAKTVSVLEPSEHRRTPPCPIFGECGGCDWLFVEPAYSRELKRQVVAELLSRMANIQWDGLVEKADPDDLGWRTRMRYSRTPDGQLGLKKYHSHEVVAVPGGACPLAAPDADVRIEGEDENPEPALKTVLGHEFLVDADGFWQAHLAAPETLTEAVLEALDPQPGEVAFDLYCGVGLFAAALSDRTSEVWGIEGNHLAASHAQKSVPEAHIFAGDVAKQLRKMPEHADIVVLDPPRSGAGQEVIAAIVRTSPRKIAYVSCDPASLARDLRWASEMGYETTSIRAFDLFPNTHHVECVAVLEGSEAAPVPPK